MRFPEPCDLERLKHMFIVLLYKVVFWFARNPWNTYYSYIDWIHFPFLTGPFSISCLHVRTIDNMIIFMYPCSFHVASMLASHLDIIVCTVLSKCFLCVGNLQKILWYLVLLQSHFMVLVSPCISQTWLVSLPDILCASNLWMLVLSAFSKSFNL